jgi:hypothetical protein
VSVVNLQTVRFPAAFAAVVDIRAAAAIALEHGSPKRCWNVSAAPRRLGPALDTDDLDLDLVTSLGSVVTSLGSVVASLGSVVASSGSVVTSFGSRRWGQPARPVCHREFLFLQCLDQQLHRLEVQFTQGLARRAVGEQRLCALHELHVLFRGAELHPILLGR